MTTRTLVALALSITATTACTVGNDGHPAPFFHSPTSPSTGPAPAPPTPTPPPVTPTPPPAFPTIALGEVVRFQFVEEDWICIREGGRCRSYLITMPAAGDFEVVVASISGASDFTALTEMYLVGPGAPDDWSVGPGARISVRSRVVAGATYEIRMYSPVVPSVELELRTTLQ